jgi:hypothetical protein
MVNQDEKGIGPGAAAWIKTAAAPCPAPSSAPDDAGAGYGPLAANVSPEANSAYFFV